MRPQDECHGKVIGRSSRMRPFFSGKDAMQNNTIITYNGSKIIVTKEVAEFLEQERKRENAEERSDRRHKDFTDLESAEQSSLNIIFSDPVLNAVIRDETLARLKEMINSLDADSRRLIELHYYEECSLTTTAEFFGITKQALSKRHAKLLKKLRELMET